MMERSSSPLLVIIDRYCDCSCVSSVSRMSDDRPSTAFMGVRISCDMLLRKSLLLRVAASASSFALRIASCASCRSRISASSHAFFSSSSDVRSATVCSRCMLDSSNWAYRRALLMDRAAWMHTISHTRSWAVLKAW